MDEDLFRYFMRTCEERFDKIEAKLDQLMELRAKILLISTLGSMLVSVLVTVVMGKL